jgi:hypothetical protein
MREVVMATGTSYRTPGTLPWQFGPFAPLWERTGRWALSDAGSFDEPA